jgi:xanthine dehydrogenase YagR molybdenum-binding subunit
MSATETIVGKGRPRIEGPLKVTGRALYSSDYHFPGTLFAVPVCSTIASGSLESLDTAAAQKLPGVKAIFHRGNIGRLFRVKVNFGEDMSKVDERRMPFEDDTIRYYGQYVALAVAETFEQAVAAAEAVRAKYRADKHDVSGEFDLTKLDGLTKETAKGSEDPTVPKVESERGEPDKSFESSPIQLDATYAVPVETHNPIELHATLAVWDGANVTLYDTTQAVVNARNVMAQVLGVPRENVRVITKYLGSGFGGKLWPWPHCALAAASARELKRPVKLVVSRRMMFQNVGHRPALQQRFRLSATPEGKLTSLRQEYVNHTSILDDYQEDCGEATAHLYSVPNLRVTAARARRNVGTPTSMRGPGAVPGLFGLESAMDELAVKLKMDPVQLRHVNEPAMDEGQKLPFSSRHLKECLDLGVREFGWEKRTPAVGSMRDGDEIIGWGMAACTWMAKRLPCHARVEIFEDGSARVSTASQDIGTGTYTVLAQVAAETLGLPVEKVDVALGDTSLPPGPLSGGSMATASVIPAVMEAATKAAKELFTVAAKTPGSKLQGRDANTLELSGGVVRGRGESDGIAIPELLRLAKLRGVSGEGKSQGTFGGETQPTVSTHSFGAHFIEVRWQPQIARLRVSRVVTAIDAGRIVNPLAGRNQIEGAVVMGIGMALFEETQYERRFGGPINSNLADYVMAVNADVPPIDVHFLTYPDKELNELGARGIGEIGLAGSAAAITNAVYHATGLRVRKLPVKIEDLLAAPLTA